jgi:hypothetical protein
VKFAWSVTLSNTNNTLYELQCWYILCIRICIEIPVQNGISNKLAATERSTLIVSSDVQLIHNIWSKWWYVSAITLIASSDFPTPVTEIRIIIGYRISLL